MSYNLQFFKFFKRLCLKHFDKYVNFVRNDKNILINMHPQVKCHTRTPHSTACIPQKIKSVDKYLIMGKKDCT